MTQILPKDDTFTENATHYGDWLTGWYTRIVPWTATFAPSGTYSVKSGIGHLFSGYFGVAQSTPILHGWVPTRVASFAKTIGTYGNQEMCWHVARAYYAANCTVRACFSLFTLSGSPTATSFKGCGVGARIAGGSQTTTSLAERWSDVTGYFFLLAADATGVATFFLLRVNAGTVTVLDSKLATAVNPNWTMPNAVQTPRILELVVTTNGGGNPVLTANTGKVGAYEIGDTPGANTTVFDNYEDTSGSKITAAGRAGFGAYSDLDLGSGLKVTTAISFFEIVDTAGAATILRDEWQRSDLTIGRSFTDNNGKAGYALGCGWRGDVWSSSRELQRDSGNNRITHVTNNVDHVNTRPATTQYVSHRRATFNFVYTTGSAILYMIGRGSFSLSVGPTSCWKFIVTYNGTTWVGRLVYRGSGGSDTTWADIASLSAVTYSLNPAADNTVELRVENIGPNAPELGSVQVMCKLNGVQVTGWVLQAPVVPSSQVLATGEVITNHSSVSLSGLVEGYGATLSLGNTMRFDTWTDLVVLGTGGGGGDDDTIPEEDQASISVTTECTGKTGTLSVPHEWPVKTVPTAYTSVHAYDSGHRNRIKRAIKQRRRWSIAAKASKPADKATLLAFYDSHKGTEIPFNWTLPSGEAVSARFRDESLRHALVAPNVRSFEVELEEVFC